jgi:hypothetical protein
MKKLIGLLFVAILITSCSIPRFTEDKPFIVLTISYTSDGNAVYVGQEQAGLFFPKVIAPVGTYNLLDTIKLKK